MNRNYHELFYKKTGFDIVCDTYPGTRVFLLCSQDVNGCIKLSLIVYNRHIKRGKGKRKKADSENRDSRETGIFSEISV